MRVNRYPCKSLLILNGTGLFKEQTKYERNIVILNLYMESNNKNSLCFKFDKKNIINICTIFYSLLMLTFIRNKCKFYIYNYIPLHRSLISTFIVTTECYRTTITMMLRKCCAKDARRSLSGDKSAAPFPALFLALWGKREEWEALDYYSVRGKEKIVIKPPAISQTMRLSAY